VCDDGGIGGSLVLLVLLCGGVAGMFQEPTVLPVVALNFADSRDQDAGESICEAFMIASFHAHAYTIQFVAT
jgi:hypothetical protein